jgi:UDP-N-acetylglucosamine 2-epimerase (non-hydrolysing)
LGVPVGHVEAGLRTHDLRAPFPEEFNRQVASKLTKWHFAPTEFSQSNLLLENVPQDSIIVTGNTVIDALFWVLGRIEADESRRQGLVEFLNEQLGFEWQVQRFVLMTGHRRENFGDGFLQICNALKELAARYPMVKFVYPVHLNPNVQQPVNAILADVRNVHLIAPLDYEPFVYLLKHSHIVLTDSGGIQEEAPSLGKPVLVMRDVTERPEAVSAGTVRLVGADRGRIVTNVAELLDNDVSYAAMARAHNPYGDGKACARIVSILREI